MVLLAHQQRLGALENAPIDEEDGDHAEIVDKIIRDRKRAARAAQLEPVPDFKEREPEPDGALKRIFGIGPEYANVPASRLVHPSSPFHEAWIGITAVFLVYTAIVTPAVISFHWLDPACAAVPTLYFDCILDVFFLLDIVYSFCVGVNFMDQYHDDWKWVARNYLTGSFVFDACTSVPVSFVDLHVQFVCSRAAAGADVGIDPQQLRFIRAMKPLRWFKLARVMKLRSSGKSTFSYLCDHFMVSPRLQRMMTIFGTMTLSIHLAACISWLVRVITNQPHEVEAFLEQLSSNPDAPIDLGSAKGKAEVYVISAYFCTTVFSTVGFGDIVPTNTVERVMAILLMLAGVLIFGNLLSDLADIGHAANAAEVAKLKKVQSALDLMQHQDVPKHLQLAVIDWIRFHHTHIESSKKEKDLLAKLPLSIQQQLIQIIFGKTLKHIPIFEILGATDSDFLRGVWSVMRYATYEPNATIIPFGTEASRLIVIVKGECEVSIDPRGKSEQLEKPDDITLMPGGFLGEFAILGDQDWGSSIAVGIEDCVIEMAACNHTFVVCMELEAKTFKRLLAAQPVKLQRIVDIFRRNRLEHKETFQRDSATTMRKTNSLQGPKMEIADFVRESRQIHHWDTLANNVLTRYRKAPFARTKSDHSQNTEGYGEETQAFSGTIAKFMNTDTFTMAANMKAEVLKGHQTFLSTDHHLNANGAVVHTDPDVDGQHLGSPHLQNLEVQVNAMHVKFDHLQATVTEHTRFHAQMLAKMDVILGALGQSPHVRSQGFIGGMEEQSRWSGEGDHKLAKQTGSTTAGKSVPGRGTRSPSHDSTRNAIEPSPSPARKTVRRGIAARGMTASSSSSSEEEQSQAPGAPRFSNGDGESTVGDSPQLVLTRRSRPVANVAGNSRQLSA